VLKKVLLTAVLTAFGSQVMRGGESEAAVQLDRFLNAQEAKA
jgi:hypothetical protein